MTANRWTVTARRWLPLAAVALYLVLALPQLNLPGLHYDEAREAGLNALEMLQRQNVQAFRSAGVQIGPIFLPLMVQDYIGALAVYLALPLLAALGATVTALRLLAVLCGLATIVLAWQLGNELGRLAGVARPWTGAVVALLLAASPSFLFWSRQGIFVTNIVVTLAVATVWTALRWRRTGRAGWLYAAAFLAGLGLWAKLLFIWVLGALAVAALAIWLAGKGREGKEGNADGDLSTLHSSPSTSAPCQLLHWLIAAGLFLLALTPLILFNQQTAGTLNAVFGNLGQSYYGVNNADFLSNLTVRAGQVVVLLRANHFWYLGGPFASELAAPAAIGLVVAALVAALTTLRRRGQMRDRVAPPSPCPLPEGEGSDHLLPEGEGSDHLLPEKEGSDYLLPEKEGSDYLLPEGEGSACPLPQEEGSDCPLPEEEGSDWSLPQGEGSGMGPAGVLGLALLFVALLVVQSSFTVSDLFITHYAIVQPFVLLLPALALDILLLAARSDAAAGRRRWRYVAAAGVAALALWLAGDVRTDLRYHQALAETGGHASHSDAIQRLADWLDEQRASQPLALDWGIDAPVRYLTQNRVQPLELFGYERIDRPDDGFAARVAQFLDDPSRLYVLHAEGGAVFQGRRAALEEMANRRGLSIEEVAAFDERNGLPVFVVLRVRDTGN